MLLRFNCECVNDKAPRDSFLRQHRRPDALRILGFVLFGVKENGAENEGLGLIYLV